MWTTCFWWYWYRYEGRKLPPGKWQKNIVPSPPSSHHPPSTKTHGVYDFVMFTRPRVKCFCASTWLTERSLGAARSRAGVYIFHLSISLSLFFVTQALSRDFLLTFSRRAISPSICACVFIFIRLMDLVLGFVLRQISSRNIEGCLFIYFQRGI